MLIQERIYHREDKLIIAVGVHITLEEAEQAIPGDDMLTIVREEIERAAHGIGAHVDLPNVRMKRPSPTEVLALCRRIVVCAAGHRHVVGSEPSGEKPT